MKTSKLPSFGLSSDEKCIGTPILVICALGSKKECQNQCFMKIHNRNIYNRNFSSINFTTQNFPHFFLYLYVVFCISHHLYHYDMVLHSTPQVILTTQTVFGVFSHLLGLYSNLLETRHYTTFYTTYSSILTTFIFTIHNTNTAITQVIL